MNNETRASGSWAGKAPPPLEWLSRGLALWLESISMCRDWGHIRQRLALASASACLKHSFSRAVQRLGETAGTTGTWSGPACSQWRNTSKKFLWRSACTWLCAHKRELWLLDISFGSFFCCIVHCFSVVLSLAHHSVPILLFIHAPKKKTKTCGHIKPDTWQFPSQS